MHVATVLWLLPLIAGILLVVVGLCWSFCMCWSPFSKFPLQTAIGKFSGVVRASRRNGTSPAGFSRIGWCCMVLLCAPCPRCLKGTTIAVSGTERLTANSLSTEGRSFEPKPQTLSLCFLCLVPQISDPFQARSQERHRQQLLAKLFMAWLSNQEVFEWKRIESE